MDFLDILVDKAFLGREFLTWLWYKSEQTGGRIEIPGKGTVGVAFLDQMKLDLSGAETPQTVVVKGELSGMREGKSALKAGKKIDETRIQIKPSDNEYTVVLKSTWFAYGSLRTPLTLPSSEKGADEGEEAALLEKIFLMEEVIGAIDDMFEYFITVRISDEWELTEVPAIQKWIKS